MSVDDALKKTQASIKLKVEENPKNMPKKVNRQIKRRGK